MPIKDQLRKLDIDFDYYSKKYPSLNSRIIQGTCAFVIYFSILGLCWALPFPYLHFLGQYNSYFNWASFVIAFSIYYYSNLSPLLSYLMLFLALLFTYLISIIEKKINNNLQMGELFSVILLLALIVHHFSYKTIAENNLPKTLLNFVLIGPIWTLSFLLKKFKVKY